MRIGVIHWGEIGPNGSAGGFTGRNYSIASALSRDHDVVVVSLQLGGRELPVTLPAGVRSVRIPVPASYLTRTAQAMRAAEGYFGRTAVHGWQRTVVEVLRDHETDAVITCWAIDFPQLSRLFPVLSMAEEDTSPTLPGTRITTRLTQRGIRHAQQRGLRRAACIGVISECEVEWATRAFRPAPVRVVPHWVNVDHWSALAAARGGEKPTVAVVGSMGEARNAMGLRSVIDELLIHPAAERPHLVVATGSEPHACLADLPDDLVSFVGRVDDPRVVYAQSEVALVPSFLVSGAKTTILQAWAAALPVVTTDAAAASVGATAGVNVVSAAGPAGVAEALIEVCRDVSLHQKLVAAGREKLAKDHSLEAVARSLREMLSLVREEGRTNRPGALS